MAIAAGSAARRVARLFAALLMLLAAATCTTGDGVPLHRTFVGSSTAPAAPLPVGVAFAQDGIEVPATGATATLPLHVLAHLGQPGQRVRTVLRWQNGIQLDRSFTLLAGADGQGLLVANLDWDEATTPALPDSQTVDLEVTSQAGTLLGRTQITILGPDNPALRAITLYFVNRDTPESARRRTSPMLRIATATLEELLWGPAPGDPPHLKTALPMPQDVLDYPGRRTEWGVRVKLRQVRIVDGLATADFSKEFGAYGGGSLRVGLINQQIPWRA